MTCRVVFTPSGLTGDVEPGTTVLAAARRFGVDLDSVCGGRAICGHCQVVPGSGSFAKWSVRVDDGAVSPMSPTERDARLARELARGHRLGCIATIEGDAVIDVPAASQVHRPVVRKTVALDDLVVDPLISLAYLELPPPASDGTSLATAVRRALREQHGLDVPTIDPSVLPELHHAFGSTPRAATVAVRRAESARPASVSAVFPDFTDVAVGVAIDVGSTTVAGHLCDLATGAVLASVGRMNPQIRFGEDLMSRVSYVMMNPGAAIELTRTIRDALDDVIAHLCEEAGVATDRVLDVVIVGNPIMHHVVLGIDPTPLGTAPFELATDGAVELQSRDLGLSTPQASVYLLPCIAGHVGADTAAAMLSEGTHRCGHPQLLVDIGTNAEIVLGSAKGVWAASSPTGPAFEGAQISCGQRATAGAIERVRIDRTTLEPRFRVIGTEHWSDDPDFARRAPTISGVCGSGIVEVIGEMLLAGIIDAAGTIRGELTARTHRVVPDGRTFSFVLHEAGDVRLLVTQNDVRAIQLAKAALRAGIDLVREHAGIERVDDVRLAGAFGTHLDPLYAMLLGLVPDSPLAAVRSVGNAAGSGAVRALLSAAQRREIEDAVGRVTKVETATEPRFQELFVAAMGLPHSTAPTPHLAALVDLPPDTVHGAPRRRRTRTTGGSA